jgi:hypothetical protein
MHGLAIDSKRKGRWTLTPYGSALATTTANTSRAVAAFWHQLTVRQVRALVYVAGLPGSPLPDPRTLGMLQRKGWRLIELDPRKSKHNGATYDLMHWRLTRTGEDVLRFDMDVHAAFRAVDVNLRKALTSGAGVV